METDLDRRVVIRPKALRVGGRRIPSSDGVVTVLRHKGKELFPPPYQEEAPRIGKFMWQNPLSIKVIVNKTTFGIYRRSLQRLVARLVEQYRAFGTF